MRNNPDPAFGIQCFPLIRKSALQYIVTATQEGYEAAEVIVKKAFSRTSKQQVAN